MPIIDDRRPSIPGVQHVLVVDGYDQDRAYYVQRLKYSLPDFAIYEACDGKAGLDLCSFRKIDCVILEIDLPDISGFEVLVNLVPIVHYPEVAVIVLTRLTNQGILEFALKERRTSCAAQGRHVRGCVGSDGSQGNCEGAKEHEGKMDIRPSRDIFTAATSSRR